MTKDDLNQAKRILFGTTKKRSDLILLAVYKKYGKEFNSTEDAVNWILEKEKKDGEE